jgi:alkanesulfonate monooxygenase SsuD/methylene tetrahydromethanopterin reductase-like flavin-dependent oxidoreductase (luciferase family)
MKDETRRAKATDFYVSIQIAGTPDDCIQQIEDLHRLTGMDHLITEFSFGNIPHHLSENSMRLFARDVMPVVQRDPAFKVGRVGSTRLRTKTDESVFAPA